MQKSDDNKTAAKARRQTQSSTTLNRKYVKKPVKSVAQELSVKKSPLVSRFARYSSSASTNREMVKVTRAQKPIAPAQMHPMQSTANARMKQRAYATSTSTQSRLTAQQLKDQAIKKALASASAESKKDQQSTESEKNLANGAKRHFGMGRIVLALSCAAAAVFAIVYFVNLNMPDISLKVAAMQTGIDASYPEYVPRDFNLSGIVSENGKISLNFSNNASGDAFTLTEETSSWDSNALLNNYVKQQYGDNYVVVREQGLTIYISGGDAAWVNGGIVYGLKSTSGSLSKKQITSIATSL